MYQRYNMRVHTFSVFLSDYFLYKKGYEFTYLCVPIIIYLSHSFISRTKNLPPGPWGLPIFGYLPLLWRVPGKDPNKIIQELGEKYGVIWSMRLGSDLAIILNDWDVAKEAFLDKGDYTSFKDIRDPLKSTMEGARGIIHGNGVTWRDHRRFTSKSFRGLGMGSKVIEEKIKSEIKAMLSLFESLNKRVFEPTRYINWVAANVISSLTFNKRFDFGDASFHELMDNIIFKLFSESGGVLNPLLYLPWLGYLPGLKSRVKAISDGTAKIKEWVTERANEHRETCEQNDNNSPTRDYIDDYLREQKEQRKKFGSAATFTDEEFHKTLFDILCAGIETVSTTFSWFVLFFVLNPDIQSKLQAQIDSVLDKDEVPTYEDRKKLPYVEAFINEAQRLANIGVFGFRRLVTKDITIGGYNIPAGSNIFFNHYKAHLDPKHWPDPTALKPERWLDEDGNFKLKSESYAPFSFGRRICIGESIGKMELFFFTVFILRRFNIKHPPGDPVPSTDYVYGMTFHPKPFNIIAEPR